MVAKYVVRSHFLLFAFVVARANEKGKRASFFKIYNSKFDILMQSSFINLDSSWSKMNTSKFSWTHACLFILLQNEGREKKEKEKDMPHFHSRQLIIGNTTRTF